MASKTGVPGKKKKGGGGGGKNASKKKGAAAASKSSSGSNSNVGRRMRLKGLSQKAMNGRSGICVGEEPPEEATGAVGRAIVRLDAITPGGGGGGGGGGTKTVKVKLKNVEWAVEQEEENGTEFVMHELLLSSPPSPSSVVRVREGVIGQDTDDPLGAAAADDTTGLGIWCASVVLARWLADDQT